MMSTKVRTLLILGIGVLLGVGISLGRSVLADRQSQQAESVPWEDVRRLAEVLERVKKDYVDEVSDQQLIDAAIRGMMTGLDPHSTLLDAEEYDDIRIATSGAYSGIGIEVALEDGAVMVVTPIDDSPAARAGIRGGDRVVAVDEQTIDPARLEDAINRMRGRSGSKVSLTIERGEPAQTLDFMLTRAHVQVHSVRQVPLEPGFGYVRITQFSDTTEVDLVRAIAALKREAGPLRGLVVDLRNNPGGVLEAAVGVSDVFLNEGVIVSADGRAPDSRFRMDARPGDQLEGAPIAVLVNGGSASAAEIVAGALHDHGRATLIGRNTYGKGSVQTVLPLSDGQAIKLTTSRYYTPSGASIQAGGITPDIVVSEDIEQAPSAALDGNALLAADAEVRLALDTIKRSSVIRQSRLP